MVPGGDDLAFRPGNLIQVIINGAVDGDVILVPPGVYVGCIDFKGKLVTLRSDQDGDPATHDIAPSQTILDGLMAGSVVTFHQGENYRAVLEGFTVRNGMAFLGGGVICDNASPTLMHNIICGNTAFFGGGGVFCYDASPILNCIKIMDNRSQSRGGGICLFNLSSPLIANSIIHGNLAENDGGGLFCDPSSQPAVINDTIVDNEAWNRGGGIYGMQSYLMIANTIVWGNSAPNRPQICNAGTANVRYCDVTGGYPGVGNMDQTPQFKDPLGGDFHLSGQSPLIDEGDNDVIMTICTDFDGDCRIFNRIVDIGADEYIGPLEKGVDPSIILKEPHKYIE